MKLESGDLVIGYSAYFSSFTSLPAKISRFKYYGTGNCGISKHTWVTKGRIEMT